MTEILSKPGHGEPLIKDGKATPVFQNYLDEITQSLNDNLLGLRIQAASYTVATLPLVTTEAGIIYVSDETGGGILAFTDGVNWRRVSDRVVVS